MLYPSQHVPRQSRGRTVSDRARFFIDRFSDQVDKGALLAHVEPHLIGQSLILLLLQIAVEQTLIEKRSHIDAVLVWTTRPTRTVPTVTAVWIELCIALSYTPTQVLVRLKKLKLS